MFKFPLQRILELKEKKEQAVAARLAAAQDGADRARRSREAVEAARAAGVQRLAETRDAAPTVGELQNASFVIESIDRHLDEATVAVREAEANVSSCLREFTAATQERQVLARLRERKLALWQTEEVQADRKAMDEIAVTRFARAGMASGATEEAK